MKKLWGKKLVAFSIIATMFLCNPAFAAKESGKILSFSTEEQNIIFYIQNPGESYNIQCQIGTSEAQEIQSYKIADTPTPIETIVLIDNSLSTGEHYRTMINEILLKLVDDKLDGELFTIATFSNEPNYIIQKATDSVEMKQAIEKITYTWQETYLTDVLYDVLTEINQQNDAILKRILIVSDGADDKSIGYTKEELHTLLETTPCPIYTMGCTNDNNEQLKNMFALSRMTGGEYYLLDEVDAMTVVNGIENLNQSVKVVVTPKEEDCDGSKKGVHIIVDSSGKTTMDSIEMKMPFYIKSTKETKSFPYLLLGGGIFVLIGIMMLLFLKKKKEERNQFVSAVALEPEQNSNTIQERHTQMLGGNDNNRKTVFLWQENVSHTLILEDVNNPVKRFEVSLDTPVLVGYNNQCQICLNYDETVSGEHCLIYFENDKFYVENKSRSNGTLLNGKRVVNATELYSGCILLLGKLSMKVEIR